MHSRGPADQDTEPTVVRSVRRMPRDFSRLVQFGVLLAAGLLILGTASAPVARGEGHILGAFDRLPDGLAASVLLVTQVLDFVVRAGLVVALWVTRRRRTLGFALLAAALAIVACGVLLGEAGSRVERLTTAAAHPGLFGDGWPSAPGIASLTALVVATSPELSARWRQALWAFVALLSVMRIVTADEVPLDIVVAVGLGGVVACIVMLAFGRAVVSASPATMRAALRRAGLVVDEITPAETSQISYKAFIGVRSSESGAAGRLWLKSRGDQETELDGLQRIYRKVRFRDVGDVALYPSSRRAASVEALLSMLTAQGGVRTPQLLAVVDVGGDEVLTALDYVPGRPLDELGPHEVTDELLADLWHQVAAMRRTGVAHRNLQSSRVLIDDQHRCWVVDFALGEAAAPPESLAGDVAEMLAATYALVGARRAVAAAQQVLGPEALSEAATRLVPVGLSRSTRSAAKRQSEGAGLDPLIAEVAHVTDAGPIEPARLERVRPRVLVMGAMLAVAVYVLIPQLAGLPRLVETIGDASWAWLPAVLVASVITYVGAGMGIVGGTPGRVSVLDSGLVALASTFVGLVTPPGVSQVGLNVRFLQKRGFPSAVAVSASAAKEGAVIVVHLFLVVVFSVVVGRNNALSDELSSPAFRVGLAIAVVLVLVVISAFALRRVRELVVARVLPVARSTGHAMSEVVRSPRKMVLLFVGVTLLPLGYSACLYFSVRAFGGSLSFALVAITFLTVGTIASAAPTPGGIGAVEAALTAALTALGLTSSVALATVFLFRAATFWLPIPLGFLSFRGLTARDVL